MERVAFVLGIKTGQAQEYVRRHDTIWPEMVEALRACGVRNYSIYFDADRRRLLAYLEADPDFPTVVARINGSPANQRWQRYMSDIMETDVDPATNWPPRLDEAFHMD